MDLTSLNSAQIAATAFLHAFGQAWVNRHVKWLDILPFDSDQQQDAPKVYLRVKAQIASSILSGTIVLVRYTVDDEWRLSEMESYLGHIGVLKQGVYFGFCNDTKKIKILKVEGK